MKQVNCWFTCFLQRQCQMFCMNWEEDLLLVQYTYSFYIVLTKMSSLFFKEVCLVWIYFCWNFLWTFLFYYNSDTCLLNRNIDDELSLPWTLKILHNSVKHFNLKIIMYFYTQIVSRDFKLKVNLKPPGMIGISPREDCMIWKGFKTFPPPLKPSPFLLPYIEIVFTLW